VDWEQGAIQAGCVWESGDSGEWLLIFDLAEVGGRWDCVGMSIRSFSDEPAPLRRPTLQKLRFHEELVRARRETARRRRDDAASWPKMADRPGSKVQVNAIAAKVLAAADNAEAVQLDTPGPKGGRRARYTRADLDRAAAVYRHAYNVSGEPPSLAVSEKLGVSRGQARKLVMRCRHDGLLPETRERSAGWTEPPGEETK
jgi:hypothetical protein